MNSIFRHTPLSQEIHSKGYASFSFLSSSICESLLRTYQEKPLSLAEVNTQSLHTSLEQRNKSYAQETRNRIVKQIRCSLGHILEDFQVVLAAFSVKEQSHDNFSPIQQNWSFAYESQYPSYTLWCPLQEVCLESGALGFLSESQHYSSVPRPSASPSHLSSFSEAHRTELLPYLQYLPLQVGDAVLFNNSIWYGTTPNTRYPFRCAISLVILHKEASLEHHYVLPSAKKVGVFAVDKDFFCTYSAKDLSTLHHAGKEPVGYTCIHTYNYTPPSLSSKKIQNILSHYPINTQIQSKVQHLLKDTLSTSIHSIQSSSPKHTSIEEMPQKHMSDTSSILTSTRHFQPTFTSTVTAPSPSLTEANLADAIGAFYDANHEALIKKYGHILQTFRAKSAEGLLNYELKSIGIQANEVVLDAGCGICGPALYFSKCLPLHLHAITISERQYEEAKRLIHYTSMPHLFLYHGDFHQISKYFTEKTFDRIYFLESFGHSTQKESLLSSCWKVLKPGGVLYIKDFFRRTVSKEPLQTRIDALISRINASYCYSIAELHKILDHARNIGYTLEFAKRLDMPSTQSDEKYILQNFQEIIGIDLIDNQDTYLFPVNCVEIKFCKPAYGKVSTKSPPHLQHALQAEEEMYA